MFGFSGDARPRREIRLGGRDRLTTDKDTLLRQAQEERQRREEERRRVRAAICIQVDSLYLFVLLEILVSIIEITI